VNLNAGAGAMLLAVFFGALGAGYALYGRKQRAISPLISGVALMVFPYFVSGTLTTLLVGAVDRKSVV
jgi:hypothetical protein